MQAARAVANPSEGARASYVTPSGALAGPSRLTSMGGKVVGSGGGVGSAGGTGDGSSSSSMITASSSRAVRVAVAPGDGAARARSSAQRVRVEESAVPDVPAPTSAAVLSAVTAAPPCPPAQDEAWRQYLIET